MNKKLIVALIFLSILFILTIAGPLIAPYPVSYSENIRVVERDGRTVTIISPTTPEKRHPFGTNFWGYDILTLMLYGIRYTVLTAVSVAFGRLLIGTIIGLFLGMKEKRPLRILDMKGLNGIPIFLFIFFLTFRVSLESVLPMWELISLQIVLLTVLGLPLVISVIERRTANLAAEEFIESARSTGAGTGRIILKHILPHLKEDLLIRFSSEMILTLGLIGQLAIFNIFIGGTHVTRNPTMFHSILHELAGLVGAARYYLTHGQYLLLFPLGGYLFVLITFYLLSRGLEDYYRSTYRQVQYI